MPDWEEFKLKHILNPNKHPQFESWDKRSQNNWLKNRMAHPKLNGNPGQVYGRKNMNSVIIATSQEILDDFRNPGMKYEKQEDFYWSNRKYPVWLFRKNNGSNVDEQYSVIKLNERQGLMHCLARVAPQDGNKPIHFHGQGPNPSPNSFPRY